MDKKLVTNNGKKGGWLVGKRHYDKNGKPLGGIKAIVTDAGGRPVELEGGEVIINREASKKHWRELSRINQSAGNGVPINPPSDAFDEDPDENYKDGGKIEFNANHIPNKWILSYAEKIKSKHPEIWKLGGNIFGNEAFENLRRVAKRGYWLDSEEWMYIKWRSYVARHQRDYRIEGVVAMLKWVDKVSKGWPYMKNLIEEKIQKIESKKGWKHKMKEGGNVDKTAIQKIDDLPKGKLFDDAKNIDGVFKKSKHTWSEVIEAFENNQDEANETQISIKDIHITQSNIQSNKAKDIVSNIDKIPNINVVEFIDGEKVIFDGHHRLIANWAIGNNKIKVNLVKAKENDLLKSGGNITTYKHKYNKKYGYKKNESHDLEQIHIDTGISLKGLQEIYNKGIGAYKTNPESVRPNVTSKEQWAMARVYSAVMGGKAAKIDANELKMQTGGSTELLAPNGQPSKLNAKQWHMVRTPEFKSWFGDWEKLALTKINDSGIDEISLKRLKDGVSKVVDSNGEPMVVWHITNNEFNKFDKKKSREGFFFSPQKNRLVVYNKSKINSYFLNLRNPSHEIFKLDLKYLKPKGYDGIMDYGHDKKSGNENLYEIIAFEPNQIKLADGTNTTFDGSNPDIRFDEGGNVLLAPNGNPSNLTPEQYKLVRTLEFKAWFGDWENDPENASKVVDFNGEPLVVFHGTNAQFWKFDKSKGKGNIKQKSINFSSDKKVAENYGTRIIQCFLNLRNPLIKDYKGENYHTINFNARFESRIDYIPDYIVNNAQSEKNYDGVIFLNIQDSKSAYDKFSVPIANNYYAFNNKQIKLADGTNTTFDSNNPDIRFMDGGLMSSQPPTENQLWNQLVKHSYKDGGNTESCIDYIKNSQSIKNNGYYFHFKNLNVYVDSYSSKIPKIKSLVLITFNSGGQSNLKVSDTINSIELSSALANLLNVDLSIARIIVSEQILNAKRYSPAILNEIINEKIVIADRNIIVCSNISTHEFKNGGNITCVKCSWSWNEDESDKSDLYICHKCGNNNETSYNKELEMGIKAEYEHAKTISKFKRKGISIKDVATSIAKDHLKEDPHYYSKLAKLESKFDKGGTITVNGVEYKVGDTGLYGARDREKITITSISPKIVSYINSDGEKKGVYTYKFEKYFIGDTSSQQTQITTSQENIDEKIDKAIKKFKRSLKTVRDLPPYLNYLAKLNQVKVGNKENDDISLGQNTAQGNFTWSESNEGDGFWSLVYAGRWTENLVLKVVGSKENLFEVPKAVASATTNVQSKSTGFTNKDYELKRPVTKGYLENTKIQVRNKVESEVFQELAFYHDFTWNLGGKKTQFTTSPYLMLKNNKLTFSDDKNIFDSMTNHEIFFDDLFQLKSASSSIVTTTKQTTQIKPKHELSNYRIKTREELVNEYGERFTSVIPWNTQGMMDWMFGKSIAELVDEKDYDNILEKIKKGVRFTTNEEKDPNGQSWGMDERFIKYDITLGVDLSKVHGIKEKEKVAHVDVSENKTERELLLDEYNDVLFLIENTLATDIENMFSLKSRAKELKDKIDILDLEIKKKNQGEINLLDALFDASSVKPEERYDLKPYNDGFAPDGQPTSLPKNIYEWTNTEEFQNWFGNYTLAYNYRYSSYENVPCSVVVNKHYEPLIVFHGTGAEFSFFKFDKFPAMYFAENEAYSNWFAELKGQEVGTKGYIYPFFLNIRTPLDLTYFEINDVSPSDFIDWMYLQTGLDADELKINKALTDPSKKFKAWMYLRNSPEMLKVLRDKNIFDGIIYYEDNPSVDKTSDAYKTKAYIVFNANSAKIAEPNRHKLTIPAMRSFYLKRGGKL